MTHRLRASVVAVGCLARALAPGAESGSSLGAGTAGPSLAPAPVGEIVELAPVEIVGVTERWLRSRRRFGLAVSETGAGLAGAGSSPTFRSALGGMPGVLVQDGFGGFDPPRLSVRGSGVQSAPVNRGVLWLLDGIPLNAADGAFNTSVIEPALVRDVVLQAGAADLRASALALGGLLEMRTPAPSADARAMVTLGGHQFARGVVSAGSSVGAGEARFGGSFVRTDGWREQSGQSRTVASASLRGGDAKNGPMFSVSVYGANPRFDVPGPLTLSAAATSPASVSLLARADRPRRETDLLQAAADVWWRELPAGSSAHAAVFVRRVDDWFRQLRANGITDTRADEIGGTVELLRDHGPHTLHMGALGSSGRGTQVRQLNAAGAAGPTFADLRLDAHTASVWVEDRWRAAPGLLVHAGVAFLWAGREGRGEPQPAQGKSGYEAAAPRLEVAWLGGERTSIRLFAAVARGVEAPSFDDLLAVSGPPGGLALAWNPLRHQSADTIELGGRGRAGPLEYEVTVYASSWDDELLRLADSNGAPRGTVNAGPTRHRGIEAGLRWRMHDADRRTLDLALNHTLTDARFADDPVFSDNRIGGVPRHLGGAGLTYRDERGPFAVLGATWVADTVWVDHGNSLGYEGHVLLNGRFGWQSAGGWTIALEIDNMLDRNHIASSAGVLDLARAGDATSIFLPGSPRLARISVERRW